MKLVADALGPYDYLAVEWLYKPVPGLHAARGGSGAAPPARLEGGETPAVSSRSTPPGTYDPRVGGRDLGDDLFRSVALQSANLKYVAEHGDGWLSP